jgi:hypothetical protein
MTPFYLMHSWFPGKTYDSLANMLNNSDSHEAGSDNDFSLLEKSADRRRKLIDALVLARENRVFFANRRARAVNAKRCFHTFNVGDAVYVRRDPRGMAKRDAPWKDGYIITEKTSDISYKVSKMRKPRLINGRRAKRKEYRVHIRNLLPYSPHTFERRRVFGDNPTRNDVIQINQDTQAEQKQAVNDEDTDFEVERIIGHEFEVNADGTSTIYFLVKWHDYDSSHNTYEPYDNCIGAQQKIAEYLQTQLNST